MRCFKKLFSTFIFKLYVILNFYFLNALFCKVFINNCIFAGNIISKVLLILFSNDITLPIMPITFKSLLF